MALTDMTVKANNHKDEDGEIKAAPYKLSDAGGLYLFVTVAGGKLWRLAYRFDGKQKTLALGAYPAITLLEARAKRDEAKKLLANDIDPAAEIKSDKAKVQAHKANTFRVWAEIWLAHWRVDKCTRHVDITSRRLDTNILTVLGDMPMTEITAVDVANVMRGIATRGALDVAKSAYQNISQIFRHAIANDTSGRVTRNPTSDIKPSDIIKSRPVVNQARVDIKELPALLRTIDTSETRAATRIAIKLMALTFVRTSELIEAKWCEIDLEAKQWRVPAERMKMKTLHIVPLSMQAIELLNALKLITSYSEFLFPHQHHATETMSNNTILQALKRMGYGGRMTGHGFRGVASTALHEKGYDHNHIELQLAHAPRNAVSAAYNHALYIPQRTIMMQDWADYLDELKAGAKVLPFKQA